jgi:hypothetical protein
VEISLKTKSELKQNNVPQGGRASAQKYSFRSIF